MVTPSLFCHSPYTCATETLRLVKRIAVESGVSFMMHLSETREEVDIIRSRYGTRPVSYLERNGILGERTALVHCVWLDEDEMDLLAASGTAACHCPESNMKLASGIAPVTALLARGVAVALASTAAPAITTPDMILRWTRWQAAQGGDVEPCGDGCRDDAVITRSAKAPGRWGADRRDDRAANRPSWSTCAAAPPPYHPCSHIVYACRGGDNTIIDGKVVMQPERGPSMQKAMDDVREIVSG